MNKAEYMKIYYLKNKEKMNSDTIKRRQKSKDKYLAYQYEYRANRRKTDPHFRLIDNVRKRVCKVLKGKDKSTLLIIGCSLEQLRGHLESKFKPGMTWKNYGKWHVDHKIPLASAKNTIEVQNLCHYSNLQPLWARENLSKNDRMPIETQS